MSDQKDPKTVGRRETLKLASSVAGMAGVAALGAGLAVSFEASDASAEAGDNQFLLKIYRSNAKGGTILLTTFTLSPEQSKALAEDGGRTVMKWFTGAPSSPQLAEAVVDVKFPPPPTAPGTPAWDVKANKKT